MSSEEVIRPKCCWNNVELLELVARAVICVASSSGPVMRGLKRGKMEAWEYMVMKWQLYLEG